MTFKKFLIDTLDIMLCFIRKSWRPFTCVAIGLTMLVHGVIIPMYRMESTDLTGLSLLVGAIATAFAVREWGKAKGNE